MLSKTNGEVIAVRVADIILGLKTLQSHVLLFLSNLILFRPFLRFSSSTCDVRWISLFIMNSCYFGKRKALFMYIVSTGNAVRFCFFTISITLCLIVFVSFKLCISLTLFTFLRGPLLITCLLDATKLFILFCLCLYFLFLSNVFF